MCLIILPEALMLFWGIFSESVSIYGKRGHILLGAALQIIMSIILCCFEFEIGGDHLWEFILCAALVVAGKAWMAPNIEALMVN